MSHFFCPRHTPLIKTLNGGNRTLEDQSRKEKSPYSTIKKKERKLDSLVQIFQLNYNLFKVIFVGIVKPLSLGPGVSTILNPGISES